MLTCPRLFPRRHARSSNHTPHPYSGGGELHEGEEIGVVLFEAGGDGPEMLELVQKPFDEGGSGSGTG